MRILIFYHQKFSSMNANEYIQVWVMKKDHFPKKLSSIHVILGIFYLFIASCFSFYSNFIFRFVGNMGVVPNYVFDFISFIRESWDKMFNVFHCSSADRMMECDSALLDGWMVNGEFTFVLLLLSLQPQQQF